MGVPNKPKGSSSNPLPLKFKGEGTGTAGLGKDGPGVGGLETTGADPGVCGLGAVGVGAGAGVDGLGTGGLGMGVGGRLAADEGVGMGVWGRGGNGFASSVLGLGGPAGGLLPAQASKGSFAAGREERAGPAPGLLSLEDFSPGLSFMHSGHDGLSIMSISRQAAQKKRLQRWQVPMAFRSM